MHDLLLKFRNGAVMGLGFLATLGVTALLAQPLNIFNSGELISASDMNENFAIAAPANAIMAFHQNACPTGWIAADGENGTPELRGQFIRGLNDFGSAEGTRSDGSEDPDGGGRTLADDQADEFAAHNHGGGSHQHNMAGIPTWCGGGGCGTTSWCEGCGSNYGFDDNNPYAYGRPTDGSGAIIAMQGGNETRPKNVALIFCMRKDT